MTTNTKALSGLRTFLIAFITTSLTLAMLGAAALVIAPGVVFAARPELPTSQPPSYAAVQIAKPTYTPSPVPTFTPTVPPTATFLPTSTDLPTELPTDVSLQMEEVATNAPQAGPDTSGNSASGKYILVSISQQHLWAYENGQEIYSFVASTGQRNSTRAGNFSVLDKIPNAYGSTWNIWMPNWMGIYYSGTLENGIHALPILPSGATLWDGFLGTPISFGCVVLGTYESQQLYDWAEIGTPVEIRW